MAKYDLDTIRALDRAGLLAYFEHGGGWAPTRYVDLTPEQTLEFLDRGFDYILELEGISPEDYAQWQALEGRALCKETLKSGKPCGNQVASQLTFEEWKRLHRDGYCRLHGG